MGGAGANGASGVRVGEPWTGAAGIQRTTRAIMQQATAHHATRAVPEFDANLHRQSNPNSPARTPDEALGAAPAAGGTLAQARMQHLARVGAGGEQSPHPFADEVVVLREYEPDRHPFKTRRAAWTT
jgi:hypothetical protein